MTDSSSAESLPLEVEVILGVHNDSRPIERAVSSILDNAARIRVTVVAHNHPAERVRRRLGRIAEDPRVRVLELMDGVRSPANPYNFALDSCTAEFVGVVGSDDELASGAIDGWLSVARRDSADVVIAPVWRVGSGAVPAPRVRRGRTTKLDGDRDRLFERTAPLGVWRRLAFPSLRFIEDLPRGIDHEFGLALWFSGRKISFDPAVPPYLEHDDQDDRVTKVQGTAADDFAYLDALERSSTVRAMSPSARRAVAAKILKTHVVGSIFARAGTGGLSERDRSALTTVTARLRKWAPGVDSVLSRRDLRVLRAALEDKVDGTWLAGQLAQRGSYLSVGALVPGALIKTLHRHAPLRSLLAGRRVARAIARAHH